VRAYHPAAREQGGDNNCPAVSLGGCDTKIHLLADVKGRLVAIMLSAGEVHDSRVCGAPGPHSKGKIDDDRHDSAELHDELVAAVGCCQFSFSKHLYRLRWRIEVALNRLKYIMLIATR
jgi:hypothetical protein